MKLTRQGARDLNPPGYNGQRPQEIRCRHFFGVVEVVGRVWQVDPLGSEYYAEVYGRRCVCCGETKEER